jgi:hypothetical protein
MKPPPLSEKRFEKIRKIIQTYEKAGEDLADIDVRKAILKEVGEFYSLNPKEEPDLRSYKEINEEARGLIDKKFPETSNELRRQAQKEASQKYKLCKPLEYVSVRYQRGDKTYTADGIFYSYGGNSVKIGDRIVAIYDLMPESRYKFDKEYCSRAKQKYVNDTVRDFYKKKTLYSMEVRRKLKDEQIKKNEDLGFIFAFDKWMSPKEITESYLNSIAGVARKKNKSKKKVELADAKNTPESPEKSATPEGNSAQLKKKETPYEKIKREAEERLLKIANTYAGIDADQGYKNALWGMNKNEVQILLSRDGYGRDEGFEKEKKPEKTENENVNPEQILYITPSEDDPVKQVELYFYNDSFYKAVIRFKIVSSIAMKRLATALTDRYGPTDEEKAMREVAKADKKKDDKKKDDKKKDDKKKNNKEQELHWTGTITKGSILIQLNDNLTAYEGFSLTKEAPKIKEEAVAKKLKEEQLKKEELRRKELEKYQKKKIEF